MREDSKARARGKKPRGWVPAAVAFLVFLAVIAAIIFWRRRNAVKTRNPAAQAPAVVTHRTQAEIFASYAGSASCRECHEEEFKQWTGSNHQLAERLVNPAEDLHDFIPTRILGSGNAKEVLFASNSVPHLQAVGLSGKIETHKLVRVIGNDPLRQFLFAFPGGRFQAFDAAYDPHSNEWFNVFGNENRHPGEWGHWTGRGMNWNFMCASCHNTRLERNYDARNDAYHTAMAEMSVGCEACHGPMKAHEQWQRQYGSHGAQDPTLARFTAAQTVDTCGYCHSRRTELTTDWQPGMNFLDHMDLVTVDQTDAYYADGQIHGEDYEYGSFFGSRMHDRGVTCMNCHNPHTAKTKLPGNWLCMQCHDGSNKAAPVINPVTHSHHRVFGFNESGVATNLDLLSYHPKEIKETGGECVNCHMPQTTYMQRHGRHDHGFTIPDPLLTKEFGIPNACTRCHQDKDADWALKNCQEWYGPKMQRPTRERAQIFARARRGEGEARQPLLDWTKKEASPYWLASALALLEQWSDTPEVSADLIRELDHTNALVRSVAARSLEPALEAGLPGVREALEARLKDPIRTVRVSAAFSLRATVDPASQAGRDLQTFFDSNADEPAGQLQRGIYDFSRSDLQEALVHFQKAADWDASSAGVRQELAVVLSALNRPQEAVKVLREACRLAPNDPEAHYRLGLALNEINDTKGAIQELKTVVKLAPRHARGWYNLGLAQNASGETEQGLESLARAEAAGPEDYRIPYARATILAQLGRVQEAKVEAQRALEIAPSSPDAARLLQMLSQ